MGRGISHGYPTRYALPMAKTIKGYMGSVAFDGTTVTVRRRCVAAADPDRAADRGSIVRRRGGDDVGSVASFDGSQGDGALVESGGAGGAGLAAGSGPAFGAGGAFGASGSGGSGGAVLAVAAVGAGCAVGAGGAAVAVGAGRSGVSGGGAVPERPDAPVGPRGPGVPAGPAGPRDPAGPAGPAGPVTPAGLSLLALTARAVATMHAASISAATRMRPPSAGRSRALSGSRSSSSACAIAGTSPAGRAMPWRASRSRCRYTSSSRVTRASRSARSCAEIVA